MRLKIIVICFAYLTFANIEALTALKFNPETVEQFANVTDLSSRLLYSIKNTQNLKLLSDVLNEVVQQFSTHNISNPDTDIIKSKTIVIQRLINKLIDDHENLSKNLNKNSFNDTLRFRAHSYPDITEAIVKAIANELAGSDELNYINVLNKIYKEVKDCSLKSKNFLYDILRSYIITELQNYEIIKVSYEYQEYLNQEKPLFDIQLKEEGLKKRVQSAYQLLKPILSNLSTLLIKCDEGKLQEGSYTYFKALFQKVLYETSEFNSDSWTLTPTCPRYPNKKPKNCSSFKEKGCQVHQRACSKVVECQNLGYQASICLERNQTDRRYQYVERLGPDYFQPNWNCPSKTGYTESTIWVNPENSHKKRHIAFCNCICDDNEYDKSERYISLEPVMSDINNNRVIVGLRLNKTNKILSFEIEEAELQPGATVKNVSNWRSIKIKKVPEDGKGFHKLSWPDNRGIMLDVIKSPLNDHCVTGVQFVTEKIGSETIVKFQVHLTKIENLKFERLVPAEKTWKTIDSTGINYIDVSERDAPVNVDDVQKNNAYRKTVVKFASTGLSAVDAGQTTVPYIDLRPVQAKGPLSSVGLFLANSDNSGGFIKVGVEPFNIAPFI